MQNDNKIETVLWLQQLIVSALFIITIVISLKFKMFNIGFIALVIFALYEVVISILGFLKGWPYIPHITPRPVYHGTNAKKYYFTQIFIGFILIIGLLIRTMMSSMYN